MADFDKAKCQQRSRLAARRDGVEATPMRFLRQAVTVGQGATSALGSLPKDDADALARINAGRGDSSEPLTEGDVYLHYCEAANSNFIADRYAFLSTKTLKNIAKDAQAGFAFMNSHRTGGLSHPSELPFGRTFAGRYERAEDGSERALIGFYMLRGAAPNGGNGPSTDDLHRGIDAGTIFDVSVGLYGGEAVCDVCGGDVNDYEECPHLPGTNYSMSPEQQAAQKQRGVSDGLASYTLDNARCGETSAVYDGAVPGAGFNKTLSFARQGALSRKDAAQARKAYASLLSKGDLSNMGEDVIQAIKDGFSSLTEQLGMGKKEKSEPAPQQPDQTQRLAQLEAENKRIGEALANQEKATAEERRKTQEQSDHAAIDTLARQFRLSPHEAEGYKKLATEKPASFADVLPTLQTREPIAQLAGYPGSDAEKVAEELAGTSNAYASLKKITDEKMKAANGKKSFSVAWNEACSENKDLAAAYVISQRSK